MLVTVLRSDENTVGRRSFSVCFGKMFKGMNELEKDFKREKNG